MPSSVSSRPTVWSTRGLARWSSLWWKRKVPPVVIFFTRKWPGYSSAGSRAGYGRGDAVYREAGVHCCNHSCGRTVLYSRRKASKACCCAAQVRRTGRPAWMDALMLNPEPHPPHVEEGESVNRLGGEGHPVVGTNRAGQAVLAERPLEDGPGGHRLRREQAVTGEQKPGVLIRDRQGEAVDPITRPKLAFEVGGPEIVGGGGRGRHDPGMLMRAPPPPPQDEAVAREQVRRGARSRPRRHVGMARREDAQELARPPEGMSPSQPADELGDRRVDAMGAVVRRATAVVQAAPSFLVVAGQPFVPDAAAGAIPCAERRHREAVAQGILNEPDSLVHRGSLQPRHRPSSLNREWPSSLEGVLPMLSDRSVTYVPGPYRNRRLTKR